MIQDPRSPGLPPADESIPMLTDIVEVIEAHEARAVPALQIEPLPVLQDAVEPAAHDVNWDDLAARIRETVHARLDRRIDRLVGAEIQGVLQDAMDNLTTAVVLRLRSAVAREVKDAVSRAIEEEFIRQLDEQR
jgi:hypothetical protein